MAFVGLLYAVAAPIQTEADGQAITYGKGQVIGGMMTAEISYTRNSNPLYADDRVMEEDNSITGGTIKMGVDDVNDDARVMMLGDVKEGDAGRRGLPRDGESAPYVGTAISACAARTTRRTISPTGCIRRSLASARKAPRPRARTSNGRPRRWRAASWA